MEGLLNSLLNQSCLKPFGFARKLGNTSPLFTRSGYFNPKFEPWRYNCTYLSRDTTISARGSRIAAVSSDDKGKEGKVDWELEFLGEVDPFGYQAPKKRKKEQKSKLIEDTNGMDWCVRARRMALKLIEARGMACAIEDLVTVKNVRK